MNNSTTPPVQEDPTRSLMITLMSMILFLLYWACILNYLATLVFHYSRKETRKPSCGLLNLLILSFLEGAQNQIFFVYEVYRLHRRITTGPNTPKATEALPPAELLFYTFYALGNVSLFLRNYWVLFLSLLRALSVFYPIRMKNMLTERLSKFSLLGLSMPAVFMVGLRFYLDVILALYQHELGHLNNTNVTLLVPPALQNKPIFDKAYFALQSAIPPTGVLFFSVLTIWKLYASRMGGNRGNNATRTVLAVCVVFFLCQFPSFTITMLAGVLWPGLREVPQTPVSICNMIVILDSCLNFFIFMISYPSFKTYLNNIICHRTTTINPQDANGATTRGNESVRHHDTLQDNNSIPLRKVRIDEDGDDQDATVALVNT